MNLNYFLKLKEEDKYKLNISYKTVIINRLLFFNYLITNPLNFIHNKFMNNKQNKIRMFLPFSWVICAAISFAYLNAHLINT